MNNDIEIKLRIGGRSEGEWDVAYREAQNSEECFRLFKQAAFARVEKLEEKNKQLNEENEMLKKGVH